MAEPKAYEPVSQRGQSERPLSFTQRAIAAISAWYWFRTMKSGGFHFQKSEGRTRFVPTSSTIHWLNTEATSMVLKSGIRNSTFLKCLQINAEMHPKFTFVD
jgi:hypothetical protein